MPQIFAPTHGAATAEAAFDPALYPRTYQISRRARLSYIAIALIAMTLFTGLGTVYAAVGFGLISETFVSEHLRLNVADMVRVGREGPLYVLRDTLPFFLFGAFPLLLVLWAQKTRIVLYPDAIATGTFGLKRLARDEIRGQQTARYGYGVGAISLYRRDGTNFDIPNMVTRDAAFDAWFRDIPVVHPLTEPLPGEAPRDTQVRRTAARSMAWITLTAMAAFFLTVLVPGAPGTFINVAALLLPGYALLVAATIPGIDRLPTAVMFGPPFFLYLLAGVQLYHTIQSYELVQWSTRLTIAALIVGGALFALTVAVPALRRPAILASLAPLAILYGFVVVLTLNGSIDFAVPHQVPVTVTGKEFTRGPRGAPGYHVRVSAWGPRPAGEDHTVPAIIWPKIRVGETICVLRHSGALGIEWFALSYCRPQ
jgi:hypothetical protein